MNNFSLVRAGVLAFVLSLFGSQFAWAAAPILDKGVPLSVEDPYKDTQVINSIFERRGIHGKLDGETPLDIYSFTPDREGEQTFSLLTPKDGADASNQAGFPILVLIDPTDATEDQSIGIPLPGDEYRSSFLKNLAPVGSHREPLLLQDYFLVAQQRIKLQPGKTYYMFIGSQSETATNRYMIKIGDGPVWTARELLTRPLDWLRVKTDAYGASTPFTTSLTTLSFLLFLLGFSVLMGVVLFQEVLSFAANKSTAAAFTLIKMQSKSRVVIWIALWFMLLSGAAYFDKVGWLGIPFVLSLLSLLILANMLYLTLKLSPKVASLSVSDIQGQATIPFPLRKRWFFSTLVSLFSFGAFITFLSIYLVSK